MGIELEELNGITIVYPEGPRLDAEEAPRFKSDMLDIITRGKMRIILDLSRIDFMDSTGLVSIVSTSKALPDQGEIVLCGVSEKLRNLFSLTKLDRRAFRIFDSLEDALNSF